MTNYQGLWQQFLSVNLHEETMQTRCRIKLIYSLHLPKVKNSANRIKNLVSVLVKNIVCEKFEQSKSTHKCKSCGIGDRRQNAEEAATP